jgi:hypothetical protein
MPKVCRCLDSGCSICMPRRGPRPTVGRTPVSDTESKRRTEETEKKDGGNGTERTR